MSDMFSSKENTPSVSAIADPYGAVRTPLVNWLNQSIGQGKSYNGEMVAPMTSAENQSMDALNQYANRTPSASYKAGEDAINQKLTGNYDPSSSPYYQAIKATAAQNLSDTNKQIENQSAGGGQYWGGARLMTQGRAATDQANNLNTTLGGLQQQNEQLKAQLVPYALQAGQNDMNAPLQTAAALQQYGALPRAIQQALDTANYQNWQSANIQQPLAIGQLAAGVQQAPLYGQNSYSPSPFSNLLSGGAVSALTNGQISPTSIFGGGQTGGNGSSTINPSTLQAFTPQGGTPGVTPYNGPSTSFMNGPISLSGF